jgi:hypothetical protein
MRFCSNGEHITATSIDTNTRSSFGRPTMLLRLRQHSATSQRDVLLPALRVHESSYSAGSSDYFTTPELQTLRSLESLTLKERKLFAYNIAFHLEKRPSAKLETLPAGSDLTSASSEGQCHEAYGLTF